MIDSTLGFSGNLRNIQFNYVIILSGKQFNHHNKQRNDKSFNYNKLYSVLETQTKLNNPRETKKETISYLLFLLFIPYLFPNRFNTRQFNSFQVFEHCSTTGRNIRNFICQIKFIDRCNRISSAN